MIPYWVRGRICRRFIDDMAKQWSWHPQKQKRSAVAKQFLLLGIITLNQVLLVHNETSSRSWHYCHQLGPFRIYSQLPEAAKPFLKLISFTMLLSFSREAHISLCIHTWHLKYAKHSWNIATHRVQEATQWPSCGPWHRPVIEEFSHHCSWPEGLHLLRGKCNIITRQQWKQTYKTRFT